MPTTERAIASESGAGVKVVLVHAEPGSKEVRDLVRALESENYHCAVFSTGEEALEQCEPSILGAAILSLEVPNTNAFELARALKAQAGDRGFLPVIAIGNELSIRDGIQNFSGCCDDFMCTPVTHTELLVRVAALVARQEAQAELMKANEELAREQERRRTLAALIVHDLRNPLSAIVGNVQLLEEVLDGSEAPMIGQCLSDLSELSAHTLSLVAGLLDVEEFEGGLLQSHPEEIDVYSFISRMPAFYKTATDARKLTMEVTCPEGLSARFDRQLIGRILENLLDNSVRYAPRGGRVALRVATQGETLLVEVGNDGPPIPVAERDRMFERYYRLEGRRPGARANRGLGLYFCRLAAHAHNGSITVKETVELPACFDLRLPNAVKVATTLS